MLAALVALSLAAEPSVPPVPMTARGELPSLLSAATLPDGGAAVLVTAGYPLVSAAYAQGISPGVDAGLQVEADWTTAEAFAGPTVRRALWRERDLHLAARGRAGLYLNGGADWAASHNRADLGLQISPGLVASAKLRPGVLSLSFDLPLTLTTARGGGAIAAPRAGLAFETPLYGDWTAGARLGGLWHAARGGAPSAGHPRGAVELSALLSYRLF